MPSIHKTVTVSSVDDIRERLRSVSYKSFIQYTADILQAFGLPRLTIDRLTARRESLSSSIHVYRRAIITHLRDDQNELEKQESDYSSSFRLNIVVSDNELTCHDLLTGESVSCKPDAIADHVRIFFPLIYGVGNRKDTFKAVDFSRLLGKLYTQLHTQRENERFARTGELLEFVVSLVYISVATSLCENNEISRVLKWARISGTKSFTSVIEGTFDAVCRGQIENAVFEKLPFWGIRKDVSVTIPVIDLAAFELVTQVIEYDLANIDTELFGSLIYKLVESDEDYGIYGYDTSYDNTAKIINPLFVYKYESLIEKKREDKKALVKLKEEILRLKFFDPTNGPGCFLTAAFNSVVDLLDTINVLLGEELKFDIDITNFIALVDNKICAELTHLSLWCSIIQCLRRVRPICEEDLLRVYLLAAVHEGNQLTTDWLTVCPNAGSTLILGSPTYKGSKKQTAAEKLEIRRIFSSTKLSDADLCSCWLYLAAQYISGTSSRCALVLTNSICQGVQVAFVWEHIYNAGCRINFAHRAFRWQNKGQSTGVTVVVIGLASSEDGETDAILYTGSNTIKCKSIGPYLIDDVTTIVRSRTRPISDSLPPMPKGNMPYDDGHLLLKPKEKSRLLKEHPKVRHFLKRVVGSEEFIHGIERWCLWIPTSRLDEAASILPIAERVENVRNYRLSKSDAGAQRLAERPHQFREFRFTERQTLVIPALSSEKRRYIPMGFVGSGTIVTNLAFAIYECPYWVFGVLTSRMHMVWIRTVCGGFETRLRYSNRLGYNTFPLPDISEEDRKKIEIAVVKLICVREEFCDLSLGQLYNELPTKLLDAHLEIDEVVDLCFQGDKFESDVERLKHMFTLYEKGIR